MELAEQNMDTYYSSCSKSICVGCIHSFGKTGNDVKCPFCNAETEIQMLKKLDTLQWVTRFPAGGDKGN